MKTLERPLEPTLVESDKPVRYPFMGNDSANQERLLRADRARAFREWMGDSIITDSGRPGGEPLTVFHGTKTQFTDFNITERGTFGRGVYFTSDRRAADIFGGESDETIIMELHLKMARPYRYRIREGEIIDNWGEGLVLDVFDPADAILLIEAAAGGDGDFGGEIAEQLQAMGHDGIIATFGDGAQELVVFSPGQVRHASEWAALVPDSPSDPTVNLDEWIRGSKVVDEAGRPKVLFHGTSGTFPEFSADLVGDRHVDIQAGTAFYFTDDPKTASWYAGSAHEQSRGGGNVIPVYLSLRNPYDVDFQGTGIETLAESIQDAKAMGFDGLIARNYDDGVVSDHYIAFHPWQVRSALCDPKRVVRPAAAVAVVVSELGAGAGVARAPARRRRP